MLRYWLARIENTCQRGVVMVFFAILLPLLFGFMGLSLDAGLAYVEKGKAQDIADAAALAGAAHLASDGNHDMDAIKKAVQRFAVANGLTLQDEDLVEKTADAWDTMESVSPGHEAVLAYGVVNVTKDGRNVPRVRVRITKRVPVVFLSMVDGIADNIVVSAKAAAEGGGEEEVVSVAGQKIMCGAISQLNNYANSLKMDSSYDFSIYAAQSGVDFDKLNGTGPVFANSSTGAIANGREFVPNNRDTYESEIEKKKAEQAKALYEAKKTEYAEKLNVLLNNIDDYKNGVDNKRYIGNVQWIEGKPYIETNITSDDQEIDLYLEPNNLKILNDSLLQGVTFVRNLIVGKGNTSLCIIDTTNKRFGNIYSKVTLDLDGRNNSFDGLVYSPKEIYVFGKNNRMWKNPVSNDFRFFCEETFYLGGGWNVNSSFKLTNETRNGLRLLGKDESYHGPNKSGVDRNWHLFFEKYEIDTGSGEDNPGSGESGSESEGTSTTGKLRLVE